VFTACYHDFFDLDNSAACTGLSHTGLGGNSWSNGEMVICRRKRNNSGISKLQCQFFSRKSLDMNSSWAEPEALLREAKVHHPLLASSCFFLLKEGESILLRNFDDFLVESTVSRAADGKRCIHHSTTFELSLPS